MGYYITRLIVIILLQAIVLLIVKITKSEPSERFYKTLTYIAIFCFFVSLGFPFENTWGFKNLENAIKYTQMKEPLLIEETDDVVFIITSAEEIEYYYKKNNKWQINSPFIHIQSGATFYINNYELFYKETKNKDFTFLIIKNVDASESPEITDKYNSEYKHATIKGKDIYYTILNNKKVDTCPRINGMKIC